MVKCKVIILSVKPTALVPPMNSSGKNCTTVVVPSSSSNTSSTNVNINSCVIKKSTTNANKPSNAVLPSFPQRKIPTPNTETTSPALVIPLIKPPSINLPPSTTVTASNVPPVPFPSSPIEFKNSDSTIVKCNGIVGSVSPTSNIATIAGNVNRPSPLSPQAKQQQQISPGNHLNGPKKTDHSIQLTYNSNKPKNLFPTRISLRNNNANHSLVLVSTTASTNKRLLSNKTLTPSSLPSESNTSAICASLTKTDNLPDPSRVEPTQDCLKASTDFCLNNSNNTRILSSSNLSLSTSPFHHLSSNKSGASTSFKSIESIIGSSRVDSLSVNSVNANNNLITCLNNNTSASINVRKRKPTSSIGSDSAESSSSSCCIPLLDLDSAGLPDTVISASCSSKSTRSIKSSSSTCSEASESSKSAVSNFASISASKISVASSPCSISSLNDDTIEKKSEGLGLVARSAVSAKSTEFCMWKDCKCIPEANLNFLEHIQTAHVAPQTRPEGYMCLWQGCKVYGKKSSSFSWLEHHVLTHGGNKPFRCIFAGCGLSFGTQGALERHVNSHIISNGNATTTNGNFAVSKKLDTTPTKLRRKKQRVLRSSLKNTGHVVDFFDKRTMEVIKYRLCSAADFEDSTHSCTFKSQVLSKRISTNQEPHLFVRWYPEFILPDEWIPQSKYESSRSVPFRQIPSDKIRILFPQMFPPARKEKAQRKWKPPVESSSTSAILKPKPTSGHINGCVDTNPCSCNCPAEPDDCTTLKSVWAMFLAERFLS